MKFVPLKPLLLTCICCLQLSLLGCTTIGTKLLPKNRIGLNTAMITSEEEQLLLNIVRRQFEDRPAFMSVESITTSNTLGQSAGSSWGYSPSIGRNRNVDPDGIESFSFSFGIGNSLNLNQSINYSDSPTISFSPLQGEKFTKQMLSPIPISTLVLMLKSGWHFKRLMRIVADRIKNFQNPSFTFVDEYIPDHKPFFELVDLIRKLQQEDKIYFELGEITEVRVPISEAREETETKTAVPTTAPEVTAAPATGQATPLPK